MTIEQIKDLKLRVEALAQYISIDEKNDKINNDRQLSLSAGFWDNNDRATAILKEIKTNAFWIDLYNEVKTALDDFIILFEFWKQGETTEEETKIAYEFAIEKIDELEFKSTLNQLEDELPAVLTINAGAGGTESQDWVEMLLRMYRMYGEKN